jgi:hypothetical protein
MQRLTNFETLPYHPQSVKFWTGSWWLVTNQRYMRNSKQPSIEPWWTLCFIMPQSEYTLYMKSNDFISI